MELLHRGVAQVDQDAAFRDVGRAGTETVFERDHELAGEPFIVPTAVADLGQPQEDRAAPLEPLSESRDVLSCGIDRAGLGRRIGGRLPDARGALGDR